MGDLFVGIVDCFDCWIVWLVLVWTILLSLVKESRMIEKTTNDEENSPHHGIILRSVYILRC